MKQSSNTVITIISFVLLQFLAPFAMNRAEAETIKRVIATYDFDLGTSNIYTWTKVGDTDYKLANWPGAQMTAFPDSSRIFCYDFTSTDDLEKAKTGIIFNNNGSGQTVDITPELTSNHKSYVYKVKDGSSKWTGDLRITTDVLIGPGTGEVFALYTAQKVNGKKVCGIPVNICLRSTSLPKEQTGTTILRLMEVIPMRKFISELLILRRLENMELKRIMKKSVRKSRRLCMGDILTATASC